MKGDQETNRLVDERDRLDQKLDELADLIHDAEQEEEDAPTEGIRREANEVAARGRGVAHLIEEYGSDAEISVKGLNSGEYARVDDKVAEIRQNKSGPVPGAYRNVFAAAGLVDAPFLDEDADFDDRQAAISDQPVEVTKYLEARVNDLTTVSQGNWTPLRERLEARRTE
ncbi:MAG: hypothetical protein ABEH81_04015 [Halopenitus sp.]